MAAQPLELSVCRRQSTTKLLFTGESWYSKWEKCSVFLCILYENRIPCFALRALSEGNTKIRWILLQILLFHFGSNDTEQQVHKTTARALSSPSAKYMLRENYLGEKKYIVVNIPILSCLGTTWEEGVRPTRPCSFWTWLSWSGVLWQYWKEWEGGVMNSQPKLSLNTMKWWMRLDKLISTGCPGESPSPTEEAGSYGNVSDPGSQLSPWVLFSNYELVAVHSFPEDKDLATVKHAVANSRLGYHLGHIFWIWSSSHLLRSHLILFLSFTEAETRKVLSWVCLNLLVRFRTASNHSVACS